jgi:hypothetical protein
MSVAALRPNLDALASIHPLDKELDNIRSAVVVWLASNLAKFPSTGEIEADEVLSEVYLRLRERFSYYQPHKGSLDPWVRRSTVNAMGDIIPKLLGLKRVQVDHVVTWKKREVPLRKSTAKKLHRSN